jgi:hypothetical protein
MRAFVYYVIFLGIAGLLYDALALNGYYFKILYSQMHQFEQRAAKPIYDISSQSRRHW